jgi:hypothetical protein
MNLTDIRAAYTVNLVEKLSHCFDSIETAMVNNFRDIENGKSLTMFEVNIGRYQTTFDLDYKADMIKQIKERYAENWDIIHVPEDRKKNSHFIFTYKGQPAGYAAHIKLNSIITEEPEQEPEPLERTEMLDLRQ